MHSISSWGGLDTVSVFLYTAGALGWVYTYFHTVRHALRAQTLAIPFLAVCLNVTWEFYISYWLGLSGHQLTTYCETLEIDQSQKIVIYLNRIWFGVDVFITYFMFRYGWKQLRSPFLQKQFPLLLIFSLISGYALQSTFIACNDLTITGPLIAWIINIVMSAGFIHMFFLPKSFTGNNRHVAWGKFIGTTCISLNWVYISMGPEFLESALFILVGGVVCFVLDAVYLYLLYFRQDLRGE